MATVATPGMCIRAGECQVARLGRCVNIPLGARFVCPGCGHSLAPPSQPSVLASRRASIHAAPLAIFAGVGLFVLGGSVLLGWQIGAVRTAHAAPSRAVASLPKSAGRTALPPPPAALPQSGPEPAALPQPPPAAEAARPDVADSARAAHSPDASPHVVSTLAQPAISATLIQPAMARLPVPAAAVPEPTRPDRPFSARTATGGVPAFPAAYNPHRSGRVTVSCMIGTEGAPSGCRTLWEQGGNAFADSVQSWLSTGQVRFAPPIRQGKPEAGRQSWTVVFN